MKKSMNITLAVLLCTATISYSQSTSGSGGAGNGAAKSSTSASPKQTQSGQSASQSTRGSQDGNDKKLNASEQQGVKANEVGSSTRPGGESNANANYVGSNRESEGDSKSMLNSKEAREKRRKNMTEADTTMKKGSGSARRNTKDHTGVTGNYRNEEIKHNQKTQPRPSTKKD
ncbi:hypothetical protein [Dyadobacter sp. Leaf189]|uniref:hypothetical protein n=1 Tax=Dyadobacter sp. Leaf189 TaxID=1736295 RepID=UPI0006F97555|nr:hypothetical protein [Dyadobacter sp. Leaf189]KQS30962.1 hypothetical protein ASG33_11400 [Dyadobacter sp. Leaf189]